MLVLILAFVIGCLPASAHDFWIEPSSFSPAVGDRVGLTLRVGDHFVGYPFPRDPAHVVAFFSRDASGDRTVPGIPGRSPAGALRARSPGTILVGYRSTRTRVSLEAGAFESYLREVGLDRVVTARTVSGASTKEGREAYSRCAKAILSSGGAPGPGFDGLLNLDLEIVPERDPRAARREGPLTVRLLYLGRPLAGVRLAASHEADLVPASVAVTDADGRAALSVDRPGVWMIAAVHMVPAPEDVDADWESVWSTLTFERRP